MNIKLLLKSLFTLIGSALFINAGATIHVVQTQNYSFSPAIMNVNVGDTIRWVRINGDHTTTSRTIPGGAAAWDQALNVGDQAFDYKVTVAGTYNYVCEPHENNGMVASFTASNATGISETIAQGEVRAYPNPFIEELFVETADANATITVSDMLGKQVNNVSIQKLEGKIRIEAGQLVPGIYMVTIAGRGEGEKEKTIKVIKGR